MKMTKRGVPLTRASETMTEAQFFSWIRSGIRRMSLRWRPRNEVLRDHRRPYTGENKRTKWEYSCNSCKQWFIMKDIEVDHIVKCGSIKTFDDVGTFLERLLCEKDGYQVLCKECHLKKTNERHVR